MPTPFESILRALSHQRGVTAALIVSERDGIVVDSNILVGQSGDKVAALAASLYRKARLAAEAAGMGAVSFMQLEAPQGRICAAGAGDLVIVVTSAPAVNVGLVRVALLRSAAELAAQSGRGFR